jgi:hypothetical protein
MMRAGLFGLQIDGVALQSLGPEFLAEEPRWIE